MIQGLQPDLLLADKVGKLRKGSCNLLASLLIEQALDLFLSSRLALLRGRLAAGTDAKGDSSSGALAALLRELAALVQDTICQASGAAAIRTHICR